MKTKFILHGGFIPGTPQENNTFFQEVLKESPLEVKVLLVYFAKEADRIQKNKEEDIEQFNKNKGERTLLFDVATEELFPDQIRASDIIYFHGGNTAKILDTVKKYPDLSALLAGKIVAADSAGTNVLAAAFYSLRLGAMEGLGIVPIKIVCHYLEVNKHKLDSIRPELPTLFLKEYEFKVLYSE